MGGWPASLGGRGSSPAFPGKIEIADGRTLRVCAAPLISEKSQARWQVRVGTWVFAVRRVVRTVGDRQARTPKLFALIHGRVHSLLYQEGAVVPAHEAVLVLEAFGSLVPHALPVDVRIVRWKTGAEEIVKAGQELAEFELLAKS